MLLLAGLMGMMAVGAAALWGLEEPVTAEGAGPDGPDEEEADHTRDDGTGVSITDIATGDEGGDGGGFIVLSGTDGADDLAGTRYKDLVNGYDGGDLVSGDAGDDELRGGEGDDTVSGGDGNDRIDGDAGSDDLRGDAGDDTLFGHDGDDRMDGGAGDDSLHGGEGGDSLAGGPGADALHGYLGDDSLDGGAGADTLFGGWGADTLIGLEPAGSDPAFDRDFLNGGAGDDRITAGNGDIVTTGDGADVVALGDWLQAEHQAEVVDFAPHEDSLVLFYDDTGGAEPQIAVEQDHDNASLHRVLLNGVRIAEVYSATALGPEHVNLIPYRSA